MTHLSHGPIARLTAGQLKKALKLEKPVVAILPEQYKVRMPLYPAHPQVVEAAFPVTEGHGDYKLVFDQLSFQQWLRHNGIRLLHSSTRVANGDLRKFCEQQGDILQWYQSNKNYILRYGVSGVDWRFYKHPLPASVYDIYMKYWGNVDLTI